PPAPVATLFPYTTLFRSHAGGGVAQQALLLDAGRLRVPLGHDDAPQGVAELSRHVLPDRIAEEIAEGNPPVAFRLRQEDAPAVVDRKSTRLNSSHVSISY